MLDAFAAKLFESLCKYVFIFCYIEFIIIKYQIVKNSRIRLANIDLKSFKKLSKKVYSLSFFLSMF